MGIRYTGKRTDRLMRHKQRKNIERWMHEQKEKRSDTKAADVIYATLFIAILVFTSLFVVTLYKIKGG